MTNKVGEWDLDICPWVRELRGSSPLTIDPRFLLVMGDNPVDQDHVVLTRNEFQGLFDLGKQELVDLTEKHFKPYGDENLVGLDVQLGILNYSIDLENKLRRHLPVYEMERKYFPRLDLSPPNPQGSTYVSIEGAEVSKLPRVDNSNHYQSILVKLEWEERVIYQVFDEEKLIGLGVITYDDIHQIKRLW